MNHLHTDLRAYRRVWCTILVLLAILCITCCPVHSAFADDETTDTPSSSSLSIRVEKMTPVITASSGFHMTLSITNNSEATVEGAHVVLRTNYTYTFVSRSDIQQWADGVSMAPTPEELLTTSIPKVEPGKTVTVTGDLNADANQLQAFHTWGPRPLDITLSDASGEPLADIPTLHTFITRSQDGLADEQTPAIGMTVAMPLTSSSWENNSTVTDQLLSSGSSDIKPRNAVQLPTDAIQTLRTKDQLTTQYSALQEIADPLTLSAIGTPHATALMQPANFDITTYARINNPDQYVNAGITAQSWQSATGLNLMRSAIGDENATSNVIAWQGNNSWTMQALTVARAQGYNTVIATRDFSVADDSTAQTAVYQVPTDNGDITVLAAQSTLTTLAQEQPTSSAATAETSDAGRLQRFIAQSAFYQMEQPYEKRSLLVCLGESTSAASISSLMEALKQASWIHLTDLQSLITTAPTLPAEEMPDLIEQNVGLAHTNLTSARQALQSLVLSRKDLTRFDESILAPDDRSQATETSPTASASSDSSSSDSATTGNISNRLTSAAWAQYLLQAHDAFALPALSCDDTLRTHMTTNARTFVDALFSKIKLVPSASINVLSETATMPVTVSNGLPYAINVRVSSITDSMEIVTSRLSDIEVAARSEAQTSFVVRVSTSGTTVAREQLLDRQNQAFGEPQQTTITSSLQISDKSGFVIIAIAIVLAILGLWRQFHRKKDPDE